MASDEGDRREDEPGDDDLLGISIGKFCCISQKYQDGDNYSPTDKSIADICQQSSVTPCPIYVRLLVNV